IMMIDVREAVLQRFLPGSNLPALVLLVLLGVEMLVLVLRSDRYSVAKPVAMRTSGEVRQLSTTLFADYLLPFEVASIILLAALVGAIVLARKEPR
ncbi:MAG: NADH-quinone oxidoreductase subunit J, partial [Mesorhizobium sp.]